ncbi:Wzz/FepE/Etk N-terminal domain-containing protein [Kineobactrum sediminis]|nr:Wzz/FepE/Etk N-terminal domain-containing protein [Kineobactrum sediminis]
MTIPPSNTSPASSQGMAGPAYGYPADYADDEIDLRELFGVLWAGKWLIIGITAIAAVIAVLFALWQPNIYRAEALLAPAESSGGGLSSMMERYGGLASLAGVSLPGGGETSKTDMGLKIMQSRVFLADFIDRRDLLAPLMAAESWNQSSGELKLDPALFDVESDEWVREVDPPKQAAPSDQEAYRAFQEILTVSEDTKSGFITVAIDHLSPIVAQQWVTWLVEDINATLRTQDVEEAEQSIAYLREQVRATSLAELQSMFFQLIQSQTETVMMANVRPEYAFKTIDPAVVPEQKAKPQRALICVIGTLLGGMLAVLIVLLRHYWRTEDKPATEEGA